jgi:outer membrane protein OmpA-like peptidoglycan-associated protein
MRSLQMSALVAVVALAANGTVLAQGVTPARTADQIVCELSGDCGGAKPDDSLKLETGREAGFTFRPLGAAAPKPTAMAVAAPMKTMPTRTASTRHSGSRAVGQSAPSAASSGLDMQVTFEKGSFELTEQARVNAEQFARAMVAPSMVNRHFVIEGHTDAAGTREFNLKLSQARAESVAEFLKAQGVSPDRIEAKGYGFDKPLPNRSPRAPANRRVQFVPASNG